MAVVEPEQLALLRSTVRASRSRPPKPRPEQAAELPVARVAVDVPLAHLDRPFDYLVPGSRWRRPPQPGVRVRVRFAGRLVDGFVLERAAGSEHAGRLAFLEKVVSPEPVLAPEVLALARAVADRYAGTLADVLRLAVPPRHARVEAAAAGQPAQPARRARRNGRPPRAGPRYPARHRAARCRARRRDGPRPSGRRCPGPTWPDGSPMAAAALAGGRGALVVRPRPPRPRPGRRRADAPCSAPASTSRSPPSSARPSATGAGCGSAEARSARSCGTRAAMFAPVRDLGLVAVWDDGDDLHAEPRAPYPHVRERARPAGHRRGRCARSSAGWPAPPRRRLRPVRLGPLGRGAARRGPPHRAGGAVAGRRRRPGRDAGAAAARLPSLAWRTAREALRSGSGAGPGAARAATCPAWPAAPAAHRPAARSAAARSATTGSDGVPACRWCGAPGGRLGLPVLRRAARLRATVVGARRTAEELGRAFPRVPVRTSGARRGARDRRGRSRHWWSPRPGPSRSPRAGTPRRCCSTAGPCSAGPTCGPPRRRCAGGRRPPRWSGRPAESGRVVRGRRGLGTGRAGPGPLGPGRLRRPRAGRAGAAPASPRRRGWRPSPAPPRRWPTSSPLPTCRSRPRCSARSPPGPTRSGSWCARRGGAGAATVAALKAAAGVRSARKEAGSVRVQVDPLEVA